jgi:GST-like protein
MVPFDDLPNVAAWYDRMMARPATARGFEIALS